jgi:uncharacterized protein HemX
MEVIMANTNYVPTSRKSNTSLIAAVSGWSLIAIAVLLGGGFYLGVQYQVRQEASKKAAVQDALKAINAPAVAVEAPKS